MSSKCRWNESPNRATCGYVVYDGGYSSGVLNTKYAHLSSTLVMQVAQMGGMQVSNEKLLEMVPPVVVEMLCKKYVCPFKFDASHAGGTDGGHASELKMPI